ncbi:oxidoreductase [Candidatus Poribacteria bacterium]|jgi:NAD-reducing hydrogenase small subunit|nr:oxidoreductase [Candidatus Poribacteria bacterium]MBT5532586.1 oxidoreductase [Candidatus Poribacteria bacterium]MBT5710681.1 oxidoreductase [Candidatus Poribacteria bacterium]MBT7101864.1 oxidoreductase [Candidatus Poribacteria bacterium]MBT7805053.1 oxidoreductase [Candidatus Poribacteria bacterium]
MGKIRVATEWFGGCAGCHMSFLDLDEWLFELVKVADVVYSPVADVKEYPRDVDVVLIEGAMCADEHVEKARVIRERTAVVIAFGDCAVTANVPAMRNPLGGADVVLERAYIDLADLNPQMPADPALPVLLDRVVPLHNVIDVDIHMPGCPPPAPRIQAVLEQLVAGDEPTLIGRELLKFG